MYAHLSPQKDDGLHCTEFGLVALGKGQATDVTSPVEFAAIAFHFSV